MKQISALILIASAAMPGAALAQSASATGNVAVGGQVAPICILGAANPAVVDLGILANTSGARVGRIAALSSRTVTLPATFCNYAGSQISVQATALLASDASTPPAGFARAVNFTATATGWAAGNAVVTTAALANGSAASANGTGAIQPLPKIADLGVTLSSFTAPGDGILVAGTYSGTIVITIGPAAVSN